MTKDGYVVFLRTIHNGDRKTKPMHKEFLCKKQLDRWLEITTAWLKHRKKQEVYYHYRETKITTKIMKIDNEYKIESNDSGNSLTLFKYVTVTPKEKEPYKKWDSVGHYTSLKRALIGYLRNKEIDVTMASEDIKELIIELKMIRKHIADMFESI